MGAAQGGRRGGDRRGARRLPRGAADRRAARVAGDPARARPSSGAGSGCPARPRSSGCPTRRRGGAPTTAGNPLEKGDSLFPRIDAVTGRTVDARRRRCGSTSHCHLPADPAEADAILDRARAGGVEWVVCVGTDLETPGPRSAAAERHDDVHATVGLHPHDAIRLGRRVAGARRAAPRHPRVVGDRRGRLRPPLPALAARRAGGRVPRADPARARDATTRSSSTRAKRGTTRSACSRTKACRRARSSTASPVARTKRERALDLGDATCRSAAS